MSRSSSRRSDRPGFGATRRARDLRRVRLILTWLLVVTVGIGLLWVYVRAIPSYAEALVDRFSAGDPATQVRLTSPDLTYLAYAEIALQVLGTLVFVATAVLLVWRRPADGFVLVLALTILGGAVKTGVDFEPLLRANAAFAVPIAALIYGTAPLFLLAAYTFPDGHFVPRWTAGLWIAFAVWQLLAMGVESLRWDSSVFGQTVYFACLVTGPIGSAYRYRRSASPEQRQQLKWIVVAGAVFVPVTVIRRFVPLVLPQMFGPGAGTPSLVFAFVSSAAYAVAFTALPILVAVAVLRYRLFDVDVLLNRALTYAIVTIALAIGLALGIAAAQRFAEPSGASFSSLLTAVVALVAVLVFGPLRARVERLVDRLLQPRAVLTVFFLDIVGSSRHAVELGDARWGEVLGRFRAVVRQELKDFEGREVDTAGDGFFAVFADAASAVRCAAALSDRVRGVGLDVRTGIHTGLCELRGEKVSGLNIHAAARIMALATNGGVLISEETRRAAGADAAEFRDLGWHELVGLPGRWHVYESNQSAPSAPKTV